MMYDYKRYEIYRETWVYLRITKVLRQSFTKMITHTLHIVGSAPTHGFIVVSSAAGVAVVEEGGIALHESNGELLEEVGDGDRLVLPRVPGKCAAQFLDLGNGSLVPATKTLHRKRQENDALVVTGLPGFVQLALVGDLEGMARSVGSLCHCCCLERVDDCYVQSCIFAAYMPRDEDICRFPTLSWKEILALFGRSQGSFHSRAVQGVAQTVVSGNSLALPGTVEGVIA